MTPKIANWIAGILLGVMFVLMVTSAKGDSATMDEVAHIPAGYSYLTQKDMRLNPEHPPLLKDLAAIPLLFQNINFPSDFKAWKDDINGQWDFGFQFLYRSGNDADNIIFWARIPFILLTLLLGYFIFKWGKELFGPGPALLALGLYAFSPTFLAHGRLVTTDVGASFGFFISVYYFVKALRVPSTKHIITAGIALGIALLIKFSTFLLVPLLVFLAFLWWWMRRREGLATSSKRTIGVLLFIFVIGGILIYPIYQYHVWNYPPERQARDADFILKSFGRRGIANPVVVISDVPVLRAYGQYLMGLLMVIQRSAGGNTTYFLGDVSAAGWRHYFPAVYLLKEALPFHIATGIAGLVLLAFLFRWFKRRGFHFGLRELIHEHFEIFAMLAFIGLYWVTSVRSNLNIGVRHVLPTFPFLYLLVAQGISSWLSVSVPRVVASLEGLVLGIFKALGRFFVAGGKYFIVAVLAIWQVGSVLGVSPSFLAYFNELAGGPANGYKFAVDSNLDWGQDLKRLTRWVEDQRIEKIMVSYFGGGVPEYYLLERSEPYNEQKIRREGGWLAVSATLLQGGRARATKGFDQSTTHFLWLNQYEPVTVIGHSIFVYRIPQQP